MTYIEEEKKYKSETMTTYQKSEYASRRLCVAKLIKDERAVNKWQEHVSYWAERIHDLELRERRLYSEITTA